MKSMDFKKQVVIQSAGAVTLMFSQWVISVLLVRLGGFADAGVFSLAMSVANIFTAIADCGVRSFLISDAKKEFSRTQYIVARVGTTAVSFLIFGVYLLVEAGTYSPLERIAILAYLAYLNVNIIGDIHLGALQVRDKLYVNGFSSILKGVLGATAFLGVYVWSHNILWALYAFAADALAVFLLYDHRRYREEFGRTPLPTGKDFSAAIRIVRQSLPLMFVSFFNFVLTAAPRRALNTQFGNEALGYFSSLFAPAALISTIGMAALSAFVPKLSDHLRRGNRKGFLKLTAGCYGGAIAFTATAEICALLVGRPVMRLVFGEEIMPYYNLLYAAILSYGLSTLSACGNNILVSMRKPKVLMIISMTGMLFMVCMAGRMVGRYGIAGAAAALITTYMLQCTLHLCVIVTQVRKRFRKDARHA